MKVNNSQHSSNGLDEYRDLYDTGVETRRNLAEIPEVDAAAEFGRVMQSVGQRKRRFLSIGWRQVAAAVILVAGTVAATAIIGNLRLAPGTDKTGETVSGSVVATPPVTVYLPDDSVARGNDFYFESSKVYEDMTLDHILREVATLFEVAVECTPEKVDIHFYLSIPAGCTLSDLVTILNTFDNIDAEIVTGEDGTQKLVVE